MKPKAEGNNLSLNFELIGVVAMLIALGVTADNLLYKHVSDAALPWVWGGALGTTVGAGLGHMITRRHYNKSNA